MLNLFSRGRHERGEADVNFSSRCWTDTPEIETWPAVTGKNEANNRRKGIEKRDTYDGFNSTVSASPALLLLMVLTCM